MVVDAHDSIGMAELRLGACWALTPAIQVKKLHSGKERLRRYQKFIASRDVRE